MLGSSSWPNLRSLVRGGVVKSMISVPVKPFAGRSLVFFFSLALPGFAVVEADGLVGGAEETA